MTQPSHETLDTTIRGNCSEVFTNVAEARAKLGGNQRSDYNTYIRTFAQVVTAKVMGMKPREYFELTDKAAAAPPKVEFSKPP